MYKQKYIKYKTKYQNSLNIIHIAGPSGSGKTFLGNKLQSYFGDKAIIKDLDELRHEHLIENEKTNISSKTFCDTYETSYQNYINIFIEKHHRKPIIFVGLNTYILGENFYFRNEECKYPNTLFDLHANKKYYISLDPKIILKQIFDREFNDHIIWFSEWMRARKDVLFNNLLENEQQAKNDTCIALTRVMNLTQFTKNIEVWNKFYLEQGYTFLSADEIYENIIKLIDK